eukprot:4773823-Pleurochrysis_carterae.AAC.1
MRKCKGDSMLLTLLAAASNAHTHDTTELKESIEGKQHGNQTLTHLSKLLANLCQASSVGIRLGLCAAKATSSLEGTLPWQAR